MIKLLKISDTYRDVKNWHPFFYRKKIDIPEYRYFIDDEFLVDSPFTEKEKWKILEIMKSLYIARKYSDFLYCGGAHYTENPVKNVIKNNEEYQRINNVVIPALLEELENILIN